MTRIVPGSERRVAGWLDLWVLAMDPEAALQFVDDIEVSARRNRIALEPTEHPSWMDFWWRVARYRALREAGADPFDPAEGEP